MKTVRIVNQTGNVIDTKIICAETGVEIKHVKAVTVRYAAREAPQVRLEMSFPTSDIVGAPAYYIPGPDGTAKRVKSILFDDGTSWPSDSAGV